MSRYAIPNLTMYLVFAQALGYLLQRTKPAAIERMALIPQKVFEGEVWRLISFIAVAPDTNMLFLALALYIFYLFGSGLEGHWGAPRYNLFILVGYVATVGLAFFNPLYPADNEFLAGAVFLAFAFLYPDYQIYLFFILPVRVKWLALITWALYAWTFFQGPWAARLGILAATANFFLFFGKDLVLRAKQGHRKMSGQVADIKKKSTAKEPYHKCRVCGRTDHSDPELQFRYCPECKGSPGYCMDHIFKHEHLTD